MNWLRYDSSSLFSEGRMELKKIVPRGNTGEDVRTIVLPWKGGRVLDETMAARSPTLELKAVKTLELWLESSTRVAKSPSRQVGKSAGRQVGRSAEDITLPVQGPARGLGGDYPGGDACFGPRPATSTPHGLTTENSAQIPLVGKTSHWGGVVLEMPSYLRLSDYFSQIIYFCLRIFFIFIRFD